MKKLVSIVALAVALSVSASAQSGIDFNKIGNVLTNMAGAIYSGPVTLDGSYSYNGIAVSATSSEGGILTNLAGTASPPASKARPMSTWPRSASSPAPSAGPSTRPTTASPSSWVPSASPAPIR